MPLKLITINNKKQIEEGIINCASFFIIFKIKYDLIFILFIKIIKPFFVNMIYLYLMILICYIIITKEFA